MTNTMIWHKSIAFSHYASALKIFCSSLFQPLSCVMYISHCASETQHLWMTCAYQESSLHLDYSVTCNYCGTISYNPRTQSMITIHDHRLSSFSRTLIWFPVLDYPLPAGSQCLALHKCELTSTTCNKQYQWFQATCEWLWQLGALYHC